MQVYELLESVRLLDKRIEAKLAERDQAMAMAVRVNPNVDGMPNGKGVVSDPVGNGATKLAELSRQIDLLLDRYVEQKQVVVDLLERLPAREYAVMQRHYILYRTWEQVAEDLSYSYTQVWRIKKKAVKMLSGMLEKEKETV